MHIINDYKTEHCKQIFLFQKIQKWFFNNINIVTGRKRPVFLVLFGFMVNVTTNAISNIALIFKPYINVYVHLSDAGTLTIKTAYNSYLAPIVC